MPILQRFRLQFGDQGIRFQQTLERVLDVLEGRILSHSRWHIFGRRQQPVDVLPQFPWLDGCPGHLSQLANLAPDSGKCCPDGLQISQLFEDGFQSRVSCQLEVKCFFGAAYEVVFFLDAIQFAFKHVDGVHGCIRAHVALNRPCLLPLLQNIINLVLDDFVFGDNLQLQASYEMDVSE